MSRFSGDHLRIVSTSISLGTRALSARCEVGRNLPSIIKYSKVLVAFTQIWNETRHRLVASGVHIKMEPNAKLWPKYSPESLKYRILSLRCPFKLRQHIIINFDLPFFFSFSNRLHYVWILISIPGFTMIVLIKFRFVSDRKKIIIVLPLFL